MTVDGHRPPLQKGIRQALFLVSGFILIGASLAHAQTNAPADMTTPPPSVETNAPAAIAPPAPDASTPLQQQPAPLQLSPGPAQQPQQEDIEDIRPPFFFLHSWFWLWAALAALTAIALLIYTWYRFMPGRQLSAKSAYELALEQLEKARALLREEDPKPYAVLVSETVRSYLGQRFQTPSTRRTTDEFLRMMEADLNTPLAEHRDLLRNFLQSCDLVKFARYQPTLEELEGVHQSAFSFVSATKPLPTQRNGRTP